MSEFRMASFNVNSVRSRLPVLRRWLEECPLDLLCLQETKAVDADFPLADFEAMGYRAVYRGEKSYNGVAIVSRIPLEDVAFGLGDGETPDGETRVVRCRCRGAYFVNTYIPQGKEITLPDYGVKLRFFARLRELFDREYSGKQVLWTGDLNIAPTDADVTHPENKRTHVCFHEDAQAAYRDVLSWGFVDVFRKHRPDPGEFSFFDYRVKGALERNIGWRIDHILATPELAECSRDAFIDREPRAWERPSDHTPVVGVFDL